VVIRNGTRWKIVYAFNIPIFSEPWIGAGSSIHLVGPNMLVIQPSSVGHLIDQNAKVWNEQLVRQLFANETAKIS